MFWPSNMTTAIYEQQQKDEKEGWLIKLRNYSKWIVEDHITPETI